MQAFEIYSCRACTESIKDPGRCEISRCQRKITQIFRVKYCKFCIACRLIEEQKKKNATEIGVTRETSPSHCFMKTTEREYCPDGNFFFSGCQKATISTELTCYKKTLMLLLWKNSNNFAIKKINTKAYANLHVKFCEFTYFS